MTSFYHANGLMARHSCVFPTGDSVAAETTASIPAKFSSTIELSEYTSPQLRAPRAGEVGNLRFPAGRTCCSLSAIGCPDVEAPAGGWLQRSDQTVLMGCSHSSETWQLYCQDFVWIGQTRNCSPGRRTEALQPSVSRERLRVCYTTV